MTLPWRPPRLPRSTGREIRVHVPFKMSMFHFFFGQTRSSFFGNCTYLGLRGRRPNEAAAAGGVAVALMEGEAGGDPREHQGEVAQDGQAREYTAQTILASHNLSIHIPPQDTPSHVTS